MTSAEPEAREPRRQHRHGHHRPAQAALPRVLAHQLAVGDAGRRRRSRRPRSRRARQVERRDQVGDQVLDRDRLGQRCPPSAASPSPAAARPARAPSRTRALPGADHDRGAELDRRHAGLAEDPADLLPAREVRRELVAAGRGRRGRRSAARRRRGRPRRTTSAPRGRAPRSRRLEPIEWIEVVGGVDAVERAAERGRVEHVARDDLGPRPTRPRAPRAGGPGSGRAAPASSSARQQPAADVAGGAGDEDRLSGAHARATTSAAATRSPSSRSTRSRAQQPPRTLRSPRARAALSGPAVRSSATTPSSSAPSMLETTTSFGRKAAAAWATVSRGVLAPRKKIRHPCERRTSPNAIRPMSCSSPGAQARTASGPPPRLQSREQREEALADDRGGEVLLPDLERAALPVVPDPAQHRQDQVTQDGLQREPSEGLVEDRVDGSLVVVVGGGQEALTRVFEPGVLRAHGLDAPACSLGCGEPFGRGRLSSAPRARHPRRCRDESLPRCGSAAGARSGAPTRGGAPDSPQRAARTHRSEGRQRAPHNYTHIGQKLDERSRERREPRSRSGLRRGALALGASRQALPLGGRQLDLPEPDRLGVTSTLVVADELERLFERQRPRGTADARRPSRARMFVSFFGFDAFTSRSASREFSPTTIPSYSSSPGEMKRDAALLQVRDRESGRLAGPIGDERCRSAACAVPRATAPTPRTRGA